MKNNFLKYGIMLLTLVTMSVYVTFNEKNISYQESDDICSLVENKSLFTEKYHCFDFSGITNLNSFSWQSTNIFRLKKSADDLFRFKLQSEKQIEKIVQNSSFQEFENTQSIRYDRGVYLYLKQLLI